MKTIQYGTLWKIKEINFHTFWQEFRERNVFTKYFSDEFNSCSYKLLLTVSVEGISHG